MEKVELRPIQYKVEVGDVIKVNIDFVIPITQRQPKDISEALKTIALFLGRGSVELVKYRPTPRCFWCGVEYNQDVICGGCLLQNDQSP